MSDSRVTLIPGAKPHCAPERWGGPPHFIVRPTVPGNNRPVGRYTKCLPKEREPNHDVVHQQLA